MLVPPQSPAAARAETIFHQLQIEDRYAEAAELIARARAGGNLPARGCGVGRERAVMTQQEAEAVDLLRGENQTARDGEIECVRVCRKFANDGGECWALECLGHRPECVVSVADAQMREVLEAEAEFGEARHIRVAAFPGGEIVLD